MTDGRLQYNASIRRLGAGGMGQVYWAGDPRLGWQVALKLPAPEFGQDTHRRHR